MLRPAPPPPSGGVELVGGAATPLHPLRVVQDGLGAGDAGAFEEHDQVVVAVGGAEELVPAAASPLGMGAYCGPAATTPRALSVPSEPTPPSATSGRAEPARAGAHSKYGLAGGHAGGTCPAVALSWMAACATRRGESRRATLAGSPSPAERGAPAEPASPTPTTAVPAVHGDLGDERRMAARCRGGVSRRAWRTITRTVVAAVAQMNSVVTACVASRPTRRRETVITDSGRDAVECGRSQCACPPGCPSTPSAAVVRTVWRTGSWRA